MLLNFSSVIASFSVGKDETHTFTVTLSPLALEVYSLDGRELCRRRNFSAVSHYSCEIGDKEKHHLEINIVEGPWKCDVEVDGRVYIDELFPNLRYSGIQPYSMTAICSLIVVPLAILGFGLHLFSNVNYLIWGISAGGSMVWICLLAHHWRHRSNFKFAISLLFVLTLNSLAQRFETRCMQFFYLFVFFSAILISLLGRRILAKHSSTASK